MRFNYYCFIYFNIILILLFLFNQFFLFFLIFFVKIPHLLNSESDIDYQFNFQNATLEDFGVAYLENDIDNDFYYTLQHMQSYLYVNCRFFFDVLGGETTLDYIDFLDFTIYKINDDIININRNYKYIYNYNLTVKNLKNFDNFKFFTIVEDAKFNNYTRKQLNYLGRLFENIQKNRNNKYLNVVNKLKNVNVSLYDKQLEMYNKLNKLKKGKIINMYDENIIAKVKRKQRKFF
jgi:hypothetical protein